MAKIRKKKTHELTHNIFFTQMNLRKLWNYKCIVLSPYSMAAGIHVLTLLQKHSTNYVKLYRDANVASYSKKICDIHHFFKLDNF